MATDLVQPAQHDVPEDKLAPPRKRKGDDSKEYATRCRQWVDDGIMYTHPYTLRFHSLWRLAELYEQAIQWVQRSYNSDPTRTFHWSRIEFDENDENSIPTPVYDEMSGPIGNEAARLGKPEYKAYVRPEGEAPDVKRRHGAKIAAAALRQSQDDMRWEEIEDWGLHHMPLYGGWFLKSYWDRSWEKTVRIPVDGALACPECEFRLASPEIPAEQAAEIDPGRVEQQPTNTIDLQGNPIQKHVATHCLTCDDRPGQGLSEVPDPENPLQIKTVFGPIRVEGPPRLRPFTAIDDELHQNDHFGRPMGREVPLGEWKCRTMFGYEVFVENLGIGVKADSINEWWECHVEGLDWIRSRYDNGWQVKPEDPEALMRWHHVAGERAIYYGRESGSGASLFKRHSRVKEYHKKPWRELVLDENGRAETDPTTGQPTGRMTMNRGRSLVMSGNVILFDGDFLIESKTHPGTFIPLCHLDYVPFRLRSGGGELLGISLSEGLFDAQDNSNEIHSQVQDCRQVMGSPKWLASRGMDLEYVTTDGAGGVWEYDPDERNPNSSPKEVGNTLLNGGYKEELEGDLAYISRHSHLNDVESGNVPTGVTAALALQILAEQSAEHRRPRIRRIREMFQRVWSHGLLLMQELVREPRLYWEQNENDEWRQRTWSGIQFEGQTKVRIDPEPDHDTSLVKQQATRDAMGMLEGLAQQPRQRRIIAKQLGVPEELFDQENLQEEAAEREFLDFKETGREPVVDGDLDDHQTHYDQHGIDCHSEWWRDLEQQAGWDQALLQTADWESMFTDSTSVDPATGEQTVVPGLDNQLKATIPALELRLVQTWMSLLAQRGFMPATEEQATAIARCVRFRAHMAAHKILGEAKIAEGMVQPELAAPQSAAPTEPGAAAAPVPATM